MSNQPQIISSYTKPKRKTLKIVLLSILILLLGFGTWLGIIFYQTIKKVTSFSSGNSLLSILGISGKQEAIKGQSDGRTNILLLGTGGTGHSGGSLSDTMQVVSIDWKTNQIALISIPRDLWVNIPGHGYSKINEANSNGGGDLASQVVGEILGIPIQYYITLDFDGFTEVVNTLGGVDINVKNTFTDNEYPKSECNESTGIGCALTTVHFDAGMQHMDGPRALTFARSRHSLNKGESNGDFDRSERQQLIMVAVKEKALSAGILANPVKISSLLKSIGNHLKTNLSVNDIKTLWDEVQKVGTENIISKVIDNSATGVLNSSTSSGGASIQIPKKGIGNYADLQALAQNIFTKEPGEVQGAQINKTLKIEVLNGSGKSGMAKKTADKLASKGYQVTKIGDTTQISGQGAIYNCSGLSTTDTVNAIIHEFNFKLNSKTSCSGVDIRIVVGSGFAVN